MRCRQLWAQLHHSFPGGSVGKDSACHAEDSGLIPGLGRSPGEGKGCPLQYPSLENSMDCIVHGITESDTTERLSLILRLRGCLYMEPPLIERGPQRSPRASAERTSQLRGGDGEGPLCRLLCGSTPTLPQRRRTPGAHERGNFWEG